MGGGGMPPHFLKKNRSYSQTTTHTFTVLPNTEILSHIAVDKIAVQGKEIKDHSDFIAYLKQV